MQRYVVHATEKGVAGVLNPPALEAALARPFPVSFGIEFYPTVPDKISALVHGIITTHVFVDANTRTAMALSSLRGKRAPQPPHWRSGDRRRCGGSRYARA
jgi:death-on-curing protein